MNKIINMIKTIAVIAVMVAGCTSKGNVISDQEQEIDQKVTELLAQMTLEEKVGQMTQVTLDVVAKDNSQEIDPEKLKKAVVDYKVGSILNTAKDRAMTLEQWHETIGAIQKMATEQTKLKIPVIFGVDAIHGVNYTVGATLFPHQIGLAATWNNSIVEKGAEITAYETKASWIPWNFSPVLGLGRDARWPRIYETFGEDVYLSSQLGEAMVKGFQGEDIGNPESVAACAKHFLGYSAPLSGKDRTPAWIPERQMREYFVPAFKKAIDAGAATVMINSGEINGIPVHANYDLLTTLLKEELGFEGFAVTDWQDIMYLHDRHKIAASQKEAVKLAINAGVDMSMVPYDFQFADLLIELVNEGEVSMERIDDAVHRILKVKFQLGLFEKPFPDQEYPKFGGQEFTEVAYQAALESITLLKNEDAVLPLPANKKILVTGPNANSMATLNGGWSYSWQGNITPEFTENKSTILEAIQQVAGAENVIYEPGVEYVSSGSYESDQLMDLDAVTAKAKNVDYVVLVLGENTYTEKPGDLEDLYISENQTKLALAVASAGKPVILVLNEGRPRVISKFDDQMKAVVQAYLPGNEGGRAVADVLFGNENPSGKLPYTYPRFPNSLVVYDHKYTEELNNDASVYKSHFTPQYEFGHGLSYTTFTYNDLQVSQEQFSADEKITVSVEISNSGNRAGKEVVQLFISDQYASITPSVKRLKGFKKIDLKPGERQKVSFELEAADFAFIGKDNLPVVEAGEFEVTVGGMKAAIELTDSMVYSEQSNLPL